MDSARPGPGATAVAYRDTYLSWRGLAHRVDRRAQELAGMGVSKGDWVGLMLGNVPDFVILTLAVSKLGAVLVPVDPTLGTRDLDMLLDAAPLRVLITRPRGETTATTTTALRATGKPAPPRHAPEARRKLQGSLLNCVVYPRQAPATVAGLTPAVVLFTAGAGGDPRGVVRTDRELAAIAATTAQGLGLSPDDQCLCAAPLYQAYGFDLGLLGWLTTRHALNLEDEVSAKRINQAVRDPSIDVFPATPATFGALSRLVAVKPLKIRTPRFLSSGSELPAAVAEAFAERFGVRPWSCYHTTATGPVSIDEGGKNPTSVGKPLPGIEIRIGAGGSASPAGSVGPIWVRGPGCSTVAVPPPPAALRPSGVAPGDADGDGWLRTGDLGSLDRAGRLTLTGREDDLVKVDGRRLALGEVESCIESFTKVREADARVVLDDLGGPMVVARVVSIGTCRADEVIDHCARHLAPFKVPRQIEFCERLG